MAPRSPGISPLGALAIRNTSADSRSQTGPVGIRCEVRFRLSPDPAKMSGHDSSKRLRFELECWYVAVHGQ